MKLTEKQIEHMVNRFLGWKLPEDFNPDGGIKFEPLAYTEPSGTNIFDSEQAKDMIRYISEGIPD